MVVRVRVEPGFVIITGGRVSVVVDVEIILAPVICVAV